MPGTIKRSGNAVVYSLVVHANPFDKLPGETPFDEEFGLFAVLALLPLSRRHGLTVDTSGF